MRVLTDGVPVGVGSDPVLQHHTMDVWSGIGPEVVQAQEENED